MPTNPIDIARIGHRYQVQVKHAGTNKTLVASRVQRFEPAIQTNLDVFNELGSVDPTGFASDPPTFRITLEETSTRRTSTCSWPGKTRPRTPRGISAITSTTRSSRRTSWSVTTPESSPANWNSPAASSPI